MAARANPASRVIQFLSASIAFAATLLLGLPANAEVFGLSPYTGFAAGPNPSRFSTGFDFNPLTSPGRYFHLETFDAHPATILGVTPGGGAGQLASTAPVFGANPGARIDQAGLPGGCPFPPAGPLACDTWFFSSNGPVLTFTFDASVLGHLPNAVGIVFTDQFVSGGTVTFQVISDIGGNLGSASAILAASRTDGSTDNDRFFGVFVEGGAIKSIGISTDVGSLEVDDLQYGFGAVAAIVVPPPPPPPGSGVPEPASFALLSLGLGSLLMTRRRTRAQISRR